MLNRQDHDLFGRFFDDVVDKVLVAARDQLSDASHLLLSPDARKRTRVCNDRMMAARTRSAASGFCSRTWSAMLSRSCFAWRVKRSFISRSGGKQPLSHHHWRTLVA